MATTKKTLAVSAEQTTNPDGSITVRALSIADGREISVEAAGKILGLGRDSIYLLCRLGSNGGVIAWKPASARGNAHWKISMQSVLDYKAARIKAARECT